MVFFAPPAFLGHATLAIGIALLVGAVRDWLNVLSVHTRRRQLLGNSDAYILSRRTGLPSGVWLAGFALVIAVSCAVAAGTAWSAVGQLAFAI
jgi:hypothetical protein